MRSFLKYFVFLITLTACSSLPKRTPSSQGNNVIGIRQKNPFITTISCYSKDQSFDEEAYFHTPNSRDFYVDGHFFPAQRGYSFSFQNSHSLQDYTDPETDTLVQEFVSTVSIKRIHKLMFKLEQYSCVRKVMPKSRIVLE